MLNKSNKNFDIFIKAQQINRNTYGWAAYLVYGEKTKLISGIEKNSESISPELIAAKNAIKVLKTPCNIKLFTEDRHIEDNLREMTRILKHHTLHVIKITPTMLFEGFAIVKHLLHREIQQLT